MSGQTETIAAVIGEGRVWQKQWLAAFALLCAVGASFAVYFAVTAAAKRWEYAFAAAFAAGFALLCGTLFTRGLLLARRVRVWQNGAVRLRVRTFVTDRTAAPDLALPDDHTAFMQLPVADPVLVVRFRYGDVTVVKTTPCRGVYRRYAGIETDILYSPAGDKVMFVDKDGV